MTDWRDAAVRQLNSLVAIVILGSIALVAIVSSYDGGTVQACIAGIAGVAGYSLGATQTRTADGRATDTAKRERNTDG